MHVHERVGLFLLFQDGGCSIIDLKQKSRLGEQDVDISRELTDLFLLSARGITVEGSVSVSNFMTSADLRSAYFRLALTFAVVPAWSGSADMFTTGVRNLQT